MFLNVDVFREIPNDLTEPTFLGSVMTICAFATCGFLFMCEFSAFLLQDQQTEVVMDSNQDQMLRIKFDIMLHDLPCEHASVGVWDSFGTERLNITSNIQRQALDHEGNEKGTPYSEEEILELDKKDRTSQEMEELDRDWTSKDAPVTGSLDDVIESHDFVFMNFYAGWCSHCRVFEPEWDKFEAKMNAREIPMKDANDNDLNFRVIKMNCVDFEETCQKEGIRGFPTVRLYKRSVGEAHNFVDFHDARTTQALEEFALRVVKQTQMHTRGAHFHHFFRAGCNLKGFVDVARVPGTLHFEARHSKEHTLNFAYTNVSHTVNHLSFASVNDDRSVNRYVPRQYRKNIGLLDGKQFVTNQFHQQPHHYLQVVSTLFNTATSAYRSYQLSHQHRFSMASRKSVPQAKFSYQLAPVEVHVREAGKKWYEFCTSVLAIVGGAFTVVGLIQGMLATTGKAIKKRLGKNV